MAKLFHSYIRQLYHIYHEFYKLSTSKRIIGFNLYTYGRCKRVFTLSANNQMIRHTNIWLYLNCIKNHISYSFRLVGNVNKFTLIMHKPNKLKILIYYYIHGTFRSFLAKHMSIHGRLLCCKNNTFTIFILSIVSDMLPLKTSFWLLFVCFYFLKKILSYPRKHRNFMQFGLPCHDSCKF